MTNVILSGAIAVACWVIGLFFLSFWRKSLDRLFLIFALAFWGLALERLTLVLVDPTNEARPYVYLIRLAAFLLLLFAIWDKNRTRWSERGSSTGSAQMTRSR